MGQVGNLPPNHPPNHLKTFKQRPKEPDGWAPGFVETRASTAPASHRTKKTEPDAPKLPSQPRPLAPMRLNGAVVEMESLESSSDP